MQAEYIPWREARFSCLFDLLEARLPIRFRALDLGCGPGSLSVRLLARFPRARCDALDFDPVLLTLGQACHGTMEGRLRWIEADLRRPEWSRVLGGVKFDAVVTTTALHWLSGRELKRVYQEAFALLRRGGILLNGDRARIGPKDRKLLALSTHASLRRLKRDMGKGPSLSWRAWWRSATQEAQLRSLMPERRRRFPRADHWEPDLPASTHRRYLRDAGFSETEVVWRDLNNCIVAALKD